MRRYHIRMVIHKQSDSKNDIIVIDYFHSKKKKKKNILNENDRLCDLLEYILTWRCY